jgi:hypothetical protein
MISLRELTTIDYFFSFKFLPQIEELRVNNLTCRWTHKMKLISEIKEDDSIVAKLKK